MFFFPFDQNCGCYDNGNTCGKEMALANGSLDNSKITPASIMKVCMWIDGDMPFYFFLDQSYGCTIAMIIDKIMLLQLVYQPTHELGPILGIVFTNFQAGDLFILFYEWKPNILVKASFVLIE